MITLASTRHLLEGLFKQHRAAVRKQQPLDRLWQIFFEHQWFSRQLERSTRYVVCKYNYPTHIFEDVQQEALLRFARLLEKDPMLGYQAERGSYEYYLKLVVYHCCLKSLRSFSRIDEPVLFPELNESQHPLLDENDLIDEQLDFQQSVSCLQEPYRSTVQSVCDGMSIRGIAKQQNRSPRTVYRWLDQSVEQLSALCNESRAAYRFTPHQRK